MRVSKIDPAKKERVKSALQEAAENHKMSEIALDSGVTQASLAGFLATNSLGEEKFNDLTHWLVTAEYLPSCYDPYPDPESGDEGEKADKPAEEKKEEKKPVEAVVEPVEVKVETPVEDPVKKKKKEEEREDAKRVRFEQEYLDVCNAHNRLIKALYDRYEAEKDLPGYPKAEVEALRAADKAHDEYKKAHPYGQ